MISTNAKKRDLELTARLATVGAIFQECTSSKYGTDPIAYTVRFTFADDNGPTHTYQGGKAVPAYYGYKLRIKGRDNLDRVTATHDLLHNTIRYVRWNWLYTEYDIETLNRAYTYEMDRYGRLLKDMALAQLRGIVVENLAEIMTQRDKAKIAVDAYDQAVARLEAKVGDQIPGETYYYR